MSILGDDPAGQLNCAPYPWRNPLSPQHAIELNKQLKRFKDVKETHLRLGLGFSG